MEIETPPQETGPCWRRRRYVVVIMAFFGYLFAYTLRTNMNVAIISMIQKSNVTLSNGTVVEQQLYNWSKKEQGYVLSSFFWGYIITQFPGGFFSIKFGGVLVLGLSVLISSIVTLLCPVCAYGNLWLLVFSRLVIGLFSGPIFPSANAIWARWAPPKEKALIVSFVFSGTIIGTVFGNAISGIICTALGWESAFYCFGCLGIVWSIIWLVFIKERPSLDRCCSEAEAKYIQSVLKVPVKVVHPYKAILKSMPFWAICVAQTCSNWGFYTMLTQYPTFLKNALDYDVGKSGGVSAAPYIFMGILLNVGGVLSDLLINKKCMSTTAVRKLLFSVSLVIQSIFLIAAVFVTSGILSVSFMTISISMTGVAWASQFVNHVDIGPPHGSIILGISNTFGTIGGIFSPILTGLITTNQTLQEWQIVFYIVIGLYAVGLIFFNIFGSGEPQPWVYKDPKEPKILDR